MHAQQASDRCIEFFCLHYINFSNCACTNILTSQRQTEATASAAAAATFNKYIRALTEQHSCCLNPTTITSQ